MGIRDFWKGGGKKKTDEVPAGNSEPDLLIREEELNLLIEAAERKVATAEASFQQGKQDATLSEYRRMERKRKLDRALSSLHQAEDDMIELWAERDSISKEDARERFVKRQLTMQGLAKIRDQESIQNEQAAELRGLYDSGTDTIEEDLVESGPEPIEARRRSSIETE